MSVASGVQENPKQTGLGSAEQGFASEAETECIFMDTAAQASFFGGGGCSGGGHVLSMGRATYLDWLSFWRWISWTLRDPQVHQDRVGLVGDESLCIRCLKRPEEHLTA